jgi:hypothetical protein
MIQSAKFISNATSIARLPIFLVVRLMLRGKQKFQLMIQAGPVVRCTRITKKAAAGLISDGSYALLSRGVGYRD